MWLVNCCSSTAGMRLTTAQRCLGIPSLLLLLWFLPMTRLRILHHDRVIWFFRFARQRRIRKIIKSVCLLGGYGSLWKCMFWLRHWLDAAFTISSVFPTSKCAQEDPGNIFDGAFFWINVLLQSEFSFSIFDISSSSNSPFPPGRQNANYSCTRFQKIIIFNFLWFHLL